MTRVFRASVACHKGFRFFIDRCEWGDLGLLGFIILCWFYASKACLKKFIKATTVVAVGPKTIGRFIHVRTSAQAPDYPRVPYGNNISASSTYLPTISGLYSESSRLYMTRVVTEALSEIKVRMYFIAVPSLR